MTISECYAVIGGDYKKAIARLRKDALVGRFILKFPKDLSFVQLQNALEAGDTEAAFQAAHTLKGVCGNLSIEALYQLASDMTEQLRNGQLATAKEGFPALARQYQTTLDGIAAFEASSK